jgi:hypothetical protein
VGEGGGEVRGGGRANSCAPNIRGRILTPPPLSTNQSRLLPAKGMVVDGQAKKIALTPKYKAPKGLYLDAKPRGELNIFFGGVTSL